MEVVERVCPLWCKNVPKESVPGGPIGLYIHIPFCKSKCFYCDFNSFANKEELIEKYIESVKKEILEYDLNQYEIKTIYIGGGTPSIINEKYIEDILKTIDISKAVEITIEVNPGTVNYKKLKKYYDIGINRLSIGLQTTHDCLLKQLGRIHTYEDFIKTYETARKVGFKNINIDLMLGLPNQTLDDLQQSLEQIVDLKPEHISVYSLILEEGTALYKKVEDKEICMLEDNLEREMYWHTKNYLEKKGYNHYEISNFALKNFESIHNTDCWKQKEYIGIGAGASSFLNNKRYTNSNEIEEYISNNKQELQEVLDEKSKKQEFVMLGLRKLDGINLQEFYDKFNVEFLDEFKKEYEKLLSTGLISFENGYIKLTNKGIDLANVVWQEFV